MKFSYYCICRFNAGITGLSGLILLVEPGRPALAISPVEIEVFIEAEIGGTSDVTVEAEFFLFRGQRRWRLRCRRLKQFEVNVRSARDVAA